MIGWAAIPFAEKFARTNERNVGRSSSPGRKVRSAGQDAWLIRV